MVEKINEFIKDLEKEEMVLLKETKMFFYYVIF